MKGRVLVTRPQPGADDTAARLAAMGFSPFVLPLTAIEPVESGLRFDPRIVDVLAITSVNAIRHTPQGNLAELRGKTVFAVGDASASAARKAGFSDVRSAAGTARELATLIAQEATPGARILHLSGVERTAGFAEALEGAGFAVTVAEVYRARAIAYDDDFLKSVASAGKFGAALVLSPRAGALLAEVAASAHMRQAFEKTTFFCISDNAAKPLQGLASGRIVVSAEPSEDGVLSALSSHD